MQNQPVFASVVGQGSFDLPAKEKVGIVLA